MNKTGILYFIFWVICFSMTIHRLMDCWNRYLVDESFSNTEYVDFLSPCSPYPAVSICLKNPYLNEELENYKTTMGEYSSSRTISLRNLTRLNQIPYKNVTISEDIGQITFHQGIILIFLSSVCTNLYSVCLILFCLFLLLPA